MSDPIVRTEDLSKSFGKVHAVRDVNFEVEEGEVMALVGDNGAGKSTLIKMLCGVLQPSDGDIYVRGDRVEFHNYNDARHAGIETVYQDLALANKQTVSANVFLGHEPIQDNALGRLLRLVDEDRMRQESADALDRVKIPVDPDARVQNLSGGQQQAVAIARALQTDPDILIMDEPTSALSIEGVRNVLNVVRNLREQGLTIILISHNIQQVLAIADRISVLHQGTLVGVREAANSDREEIVSMMMGAGDESTEEIDLGVDQDTGTESTA
ncbi:MAG: ATP-binding cassette domain-containing protein [Halobacteriaceae archaeon]